MFKILERDFKTYFRDKATLFITILFPILLVFLLGNLLTNMDYSDEAIDPIEVHYTVETENPAALAGIEGFIEGMSENSSFTIVETDDLDSSIDEVNAGEISGAVAFREPLAIDIYEGVDTVQNRAIGIAMNSFTARAASITTLVHETPEALATMSDSGTETTKVKEKDFMYSRTMLDYYAVAMLVMILFMGGAIGGASSIYNSRNDGTLRRMLASPKSRVSIYVQTILGNVPQTLIQVAAIMIPSVFLFGAHYASTFTHNVILFFTMFLVGVTVNAVFTIVGQFIRANPNMIIMPILWVVMFISGTFSKEIIIDGVSEYSPIWRIQNAAFDLTIFGNPEGCYAVMAVCATVLVVSTIVGALLFNRKEAF